MHYIVYIGTTNGRPTAAVSFVGLCFRAGSIFIFILNIPPQSPRTREIVLNIRNLPVFKHALDRVCLCKCIIARNA